jgi:hypothetical protein
VSQPDQVQQSNPIINGAHEQDKFKIETFNNWQKLIKGYHFTETLLAIKGLTQYFLFSYNIFVHYFNILFAQCLIAYKMKGGHKYEAGKSAADAVALYYYVKRIDEEQIPSRSF